MSGGFPGPGSIDCQGTRYETLLATADTGGAFSGIDRVSPLCSGPPRHAHDDADETFVMLSGEEGFWLEGESFVRTVGQEVFVPGGKEHIFCVIGDQPGRHPGILTPGGFEGFVREMAEGRFTIPNDMAGITDIAARYHLTFAGPPPGH